MHYRTITTAAGFIAAGVMLAAAIGKIADLAEFEFYLRSWGLLRNDQVRGAVVLFIPLAELLLSLLYLIVSEWRTRIAWIFIGVILALTTAYVLEAIIRRRPTALALVS